MFSPVQNRPGLPLPLLYISHMLFPLPFTNSYMSFKAQVLMPTSPYNPPSPPSFLAAPSPCQLCSELFPFGPTEGQTTHHHRRAPIGKSSGGPGQGGHCRGHTEGLGRAWILGDSPGDRDGWVRGWDGLKGVQKIWQGGKHIWGHEWGSSRALGQTRGSWRWTELTGNWQRRYSWVSPQHSSSLGNL